MSIRLTSANDSVKVNAWTWGPLHHLVASAGILPEELWEVTRYNNGAELDPQQVTTLADFLESQVLVRLGDGERLLADGTVTDVADDGTFYRDDLGKNYSVHRETLVSIIDFLRAAEGPVSFE